VFDARRFKNFAEIWPKGYSQLKLEASKLGFELGFSGALTEELFGSTEYLKSLHAPRSFQYPEAGFQDYTYIGTKNEKKPPSENWGLVVVDRKNSRFVKDFQNMRLLIVNDADAFMDSVLRKIASPEWTGDSQPVPLKVKAEHPVMIGPETQIGDGTILETGVRIGARVKIGRNCRIGAFSRLADDTILGDECQLTSHVSLGGQGFGFVKYPQETNRRPRLHVGRVVVGSRVRIGAFVSIDRGVFEDTLVGAESSIDNIVQIGHNCTVGKNAIFCSFVGLSGSTVVGDRVTIAGMTGTKDHVKIGNDVTIAAQTGVSKDIEDKSVVKGYPPRPLKEALEIQSLQTRLPEIWEKLKKLERDNNS
jgi:UDP-3-O-[3-hydroxymyristoyl] glucosamine N-acyltransferase LpxD